MMDKVKLPQLVAFDRVSMHRLVDRRDQSLVVIAQIIKLIPVGMIAMGSLGLTGRRLNLSC